MIAREVAYAPGIAADSPVRGMAFRTDHVLFRPYSPRGSTSSGLWLERNPHHPRIWGWLLAVDASTQAENPGLVPGCMLVVKRSHGEIVDREKPARVRYLGHKEDILCLPLAAVQLAIMPPLVKMETVEEQQHAAN